MSRFLSLGITLGLTFAFGATAFAQAPEAVKVRGTITSYDGGVLTVAGIGTSYKVAVPEAARLQYIVKSDLSKIQANTYIGTVAVPQPDGTLRATEVQVFPEAMRGTGEGSSPWDTIPNSTMTNATVTTIEPTTVDKVDGRILSVKYKDVEKKVFVPANVPVITYLPADKSALTAGSHVLLVATKGPDGSLTARFVQVGKDGLVPPL